MGAKFQAILPKTTLNTKRLERELMAALDATEVDALNDFKKTVKDWDEPKPEFRTYVKGRRGLVLILEVGTDNKIYGYVSGGTKPHTIYPNKAKALQFQKNYRAKTVPGRLPSRKGGSSGGAVFAKQVQHPGTAPRDFEGRVAKRQGPKFRKRVRDAIKKSIQ